MPACRSDLQLIDVRRGAGMGSVVPTNTALHDACQATGAGMHLMAPSWVGSKHAPGFTDSSLLVSGADDLTPKTAGAAASGWRRTRTGSGASGRRRTGAAAAAPRLQTRKTRRPWQQPRAATAQRRPSPPAPAARRAAPASCGGRPSAATVAAAPPPAAALAALLRQL